jgi:hypothetical protein
MVIIKESYVAYDNIVPEPPTNAHGLGQVRHLENTATQWKNDTVSCSSSRCNFSGLLYQGI